MLNTTIGADIGAQETRMLAELEKKVQALTSEQILAVLRKYLEPGKLSIVKAGDFKKAAAK